ncbi:hypothetical protein [Aeromonas salmonicida]|uniref:hypothetical protein n=1 Tax=Aeromonas salmonicida TaxID=645 RepID=UPI00232CB622|nr:hypothetical protein [Aeromonas salmonicida]WCH25152.1 hypothetical protein ONZ54_23080 [Aeromonas salmonicida]
MPRIFEQDDKERFITEGLDHRDFMRVFRDVQRKNNAKRRGARRTLTPALFSKGRRNKVQDLVRLGRKADGTEFTQDDLIRFDKMRKKFKKRMGGLPGVTYLEVAHRSAKTRIDRASNRSNDRRGISKAALVAIRSNIATIRVKASEVSVHQEHRVQLRLEQWEEFMADASGTVRSYELATKKACAGRISIACDCGDHQYRYRYMATIGNYVLAPPKEGAFPKITNPELTGLACKHVIKSMTMMQSPVWQKVLGRQMADQARRAGYGDDSRTEKVFEDEDEKELARNKTTGVNSEKIKAAWEKYQVRQQAAKARIKSSKQLIELLRQKATKARKQATKAKDKARLLAADNEALRKQAAELLRDRLKIQFEAFADAFKVVGLPTEKALEAFAKKQKMPIAKLKEIIK